MTPLPSGSAVSSGLPSRLITRTAWDFRHESRFCHRTAEGLGSRLIGSYAASDYFRWMPEILSLPGHNPA